MACMYWVSAACLALNCQERTWQLSLWLPRTLVCIFKNCSRTIVWVHCRTPAGRRFLICFMNFSTEWESDSCKISTHQGHTHSQSFQRLRLEFRRSHFLPPGPLLAPTNLQQTELFRQVSCGGDRWGLSQWQKVTMRDCESQSLGNTDFQKSYNISHIFCFYAFQCIFFKNSGN